ncbi:LOW QUALITY PROTEIN: putative F-box protein At5g62060 [Argentina anserina]|uniref:LOW QUALITY PROTEIN: putative F-box protein At5g62060 n=1 Tax=Argentina anserina TaxID=57926 RepID=UPI002176722E|nr:LOW QUALITY PROTEIN: putative F-box protein At5g62060 [Potentilla anserina]
MLTYLPEDVIVKILERLLPIKSLIRFTCVLKRWKFFILSDPQFAKSHFQIASQQQTLSYRLLIFSPFSKSGFESLDFNTPSSSSRELICPFRLTKTVVNIYFSGFGYVSAIDDYKVLIVRNNDHRAGVFSLRANTWKIIECFSPSGLHLDENDGVLLHEALHWFDFEKLDIVAFDLAKEEFRRMSMPAVDYHYERYVWENFGYTLQFWGLLLEDACVHSIIQILIMLDVLICGS